MYFRALVFGLLFFFLTVQSSFAQADGTEHDHNYYRSALDRIMYDVDVCEKPNDNNVDLMSCREKAVNEIKMLMKEYVYASQHFMVDKKHGAALAAAQKAWEKQFSIDLNAGYLQFDPLGTLRISGGALLLLDLYRLRMETLIAMRG